MLNATWSGARSYAAAGWRIHASWGDTPHLAPRPIQPPAQQVAAPAIGQQLFIAPAGWLDSTPPAAHFAGRKDEYGAAQYTLNASWAGAAPYVAPVWGINASWGSVQVIGARAAVPPAQQVGAHAVAIAQKVEPAGWQDGGEPQAFQVSLEADYLRAQFWLDASWHGQPIYGAPRWNVSASWARVLQAFPAGFPCSAVGAPTLIQQRFIRPQGFDAGGVGGGTSALHPWQYAAPRWRLNASWVGAGEYTPPRWVLNASWTLPGDDSYIALVGWDSASIGRDTAVELRAVALVVSGIEPPAPQVGEHDVAHRNRRIEAEGFDSSAIPDRRLDGNAWYGEGTWVSHHLRYVYGAGGAGTGERHGRTWVSHSPRTVDLDLRGIEPGFVGWPLVGYTRTIAPMGWESTQWLTTIVPEKQTLQPYGWEDSKPDSAEQPLPRVEYLHRQVLQREIGCTQEFGKPYVWLSRQYVQHFSGDGSGLGAPQWGEGTLVLNRNRSVRPDGYYRERFGYVHVRKTGRAVLAHGVEPPAPPKPWVSLWTQYVGAPGIWPPYVSPYLFVLNNARVVQAHGCESRAAFGVPALENLRRVFPMQGWRSEVFGTAFIAPAVRGIEFDARWQTIDSLAMGRPVVKLGVRYVQPQGIWQFSSSDPQIWAPWVYEVKRSITPPWYEKTMFGQAAIRNLSQDIRPWGIIYTLWGEQTRLHSSWQFVQPAGIGVPPFGRARIADRKQWVWARGVEHSAFGKHRVTKTGTDQPFTQRIDLRRLDWVEGDGWVERPVGYGIEPPYRQVGTPDLTYGYIYPAGIYVGGMGQAEIRGGIKVQPGIGRVQFDGPAVTHKNRTIFPEGIKQIITTASFGKPRVSPHTIYVMGNPPAQAAQNHPGTYYRPANGGARVGHPSVLGSSANVIKPYGFGADPYSASVDVLGTPFLEHRRRYLAARGWKSSRVGWHMLWPFDQDIVLDSESGDEEDGYGFCATAIGTPGVRRSGAMQGGVAARGLEELRFGRAEVQNFHRTLLLGGWDSLQLGNSRGQKYPYMPQSLCVQHASEHWPPMDGFVATLWGTPWVSHRVREVAPAGWVSFTCTYTPEHFARRMRVWRTGGDAPVTPTPQPQPQSQTIQPRGFECVWQHGVPDVKHRLHRVRAGVICPPTNQVSILAEVRHVA